MSKRKKKRPAPDSAATSPGARSDSGAGVEGTDISFWRGLAAEPVALGLGLLIVLRPWRDGLTFTAFNAYFFAIVLALGAAWCARGLLRPVSLRAPVAVLLLTAFTGVAWLTGFASYAYDPTSRGLQRLAIYLLLFVLASNGLRTRRAVCIVLGAMVVGWLLNSLWTIFHYNVMLKGMRQVLKENPRVLLQFFGTLEPTPELKHRLESNRAFGTFLFPNALGAFLILGIPVLGAVMPNAIAALRSLSGGRSRPESKYLGWMALGLGLGLSFVTLSILYFGNEFIGLTRPGQEAPIAGAYRPFLFFLPVAAAVGGGAGWFVRARGLPSFGRFCLGVAVPAALGASLVALWLSYSRGSAAALVGASALAVLLARGTRLPWNARLARAGVVSLLIGGALLFSRPGDAQDGDGYRIPDPIPSSLRYEQRKYEEAEKENRTINVKGAERELASLSDLSSFRLRVSYWQVSMKMFMGNFWTGVGLGNFQTAYPGYQFLGAGDVETAHNDFLQYFCETGIFGGALFVAFWVYFGVWGARRILGEENGETRRWLAGIYAGALGFALHGLVDFDFQNPSLAMPAFTVAGLFYALANVNRAETPSSLVSHRRIGGLVSAVLCVVVLFCTASVVRAFLFDLGLAEGRGVWRLYAVGDRKPMKARLDAANIVWKVLNPPPDSPLNQPGIARVVQLRGALRVVPDLTQLESVGVLGAPAPESPKGWRPLNPGETPSPESLLFFTDLPRARQVVTEQCERRIAVLVEWDKSYPHDPEVSAHIFSWYEMLHNNPADPAAKRRYALEAERWAKATVDRSPHMSWWWLNYAKALWMRGNIERGKLGLEYFHTGLGYYRKAHELYPRSAAIAKDYGKALESLGAALVKAGRAQEGQGLLVEGQAMSERAVILDRYDQLIW